jgi:para-nitrobenzyl esterase
VSLLITSTLLVTGCGKRATPAVSGADPATRRTTQSGDVIGGEARYGGLGWLGIPYAKPPVGDLRWRAPQPPDPWSEPRETVAHGAPCTQYASPFAGVTDLSPGTPAGQEDCLTLDLWTPRFADGRVPKGKARLPVMVWIHGGGNTIGTTSFYDGGNLAVRENVVVIAVQYRLGPFGYFRHAALRGGAATAAERSGNFAVLDLVRALEWVRDNVSAFGGDPDDVTIFGESAGGTNVYALLLSPQARGLFDRAIAQSPGLPSTDPGKAEAATDASDPGIAQSSTEIVLRLLERDGTASDRAAAKARLAAMSDEEIAGYLRGKSTMDLLTIYDTDPSGMIRMPLSFTDGTVIPSDPLASLARADGHAPVPVIAGTNRDENKVFMFGQPELIKKRFWFLPRFVDENLYEASAHYLSRMWKATGADEPATALAQSGRAPVFVYRFDWDEEPTLLGADLSKMLGAAHGFEIPFVFGHFDLGKTGNVIWTEENLPGREELSAKMMSYWAQFARTGNPGRGGKDLPEWQAWSGDDTLLLDTSDGGGVRMADVRETRERILADVEQDPRLPERWQRCAVYHDLVSWSRGFDKQQYWQVADGACAAFPLEQYPWGKR